MAEPARALQALSCVRPPDVAFNRSCDAEAGKLRAQAEFDQFCARRAVEADLMFAALELDFVADPAIRELEQRFNAQAATDGPVQQ